MIEKRFDFKYEYITLNEGVFATAKDKQNAELISRTLNQLYEENEQLKECLNEAKNDEKQLSIAFMGFKMKLIEQLQMHYDYANEQMQNNLDNPFVVKAYEIIRYDVRKLAEEMRVDLE